MAHVKVAVLAGACLVACRFPELDRLANDASVASDTSDSPDGPSDGPAPEGPNVEITSGPAANSMSGPRIKFEFTVHDGSPYCRFDNQPLMPCTSPVIVNLPAGSHTFHVQAENTAGTVDSDSRLWSISCQPRQPTTDTFALYRMDEGSGTTVANEHPVTPIPPNEPGDLHFGAPPHDPGWTSAGRFGSAVRFTSQSAQEYDYIDTTLLDPLIGRNLGAHSIEMWVNPVPTYPQDLILYSTSGGNVAGHMDYAIIFRKNGAQGTFILQARSEGNGMSVSSQPVAVGAWHYVAVSFAPGTPALLFVDGRTFYTPSPVQGTVEDFVPFDGFIPYEGDVDELHFTFHRYTEQELLEQWCPL